MSDFEDKRKPHLEAGVDPWPSLDERPDRGGAVEPMSVGSSHDESPHGESSHMRGQQGRGKFKQFPLTLTLMAAISVWFVAMLAGGVGLLDPSLEGLLKFGANYPPLTTSGEWWRLVSCTFVHLGVLHFGVNMWALWNLGRLTEMLLGSRSMGVVYAVSGLAGSVASTMMNPFAVGGGASGALFGLMGAVLGLLLARRQVMNPVAVRSLRNDVFTFLLLNGLLAIQVKSLDLWAHGGGFVAGALAGWAVLAGPVPADWLPAPRRAWSVLAVSLSLLVVVAALLPKVPNLFALEATYGEIGNKLAARENELRVALDAGKTPLNEALRVIDTELDPGWQELDGKLDIDTRGDKRMQAAIDGLHKNVAVQRQELAHLRELVLRAQGAREAPSAGDRVQ